MGHGGGGQSPDTFQMKHCLESKVEVTIAWLLPGFARPVQLYVTCFGCQSWPLIELRTALSVGVQGGFNRCSAARALPSLKLLHSCQPP